MTEQNISPPVTRVVWFKRDLRTQDHAPLQHAVWRTRQSGTTGPQRDSVLCLYIHEPSAAEAPEFSAQHSAFLRESLDDLRQQLQALGSDLLETVGEAVEVFDRLKTHLDASGLGLSSSSSSSSLSTLSIWSHQETTTLREYARDRDVKRWCKANGIRNIEFAQNAVLRGRAWEQASGNPFEQHLQEACQQPLISISAQDCAGVWASLPWASALPDEIPRGSGQDLPRRMKGGRAVALERLAAFTEFDRLAAYPKFISTPIDAEDGCSRLSPHLAFGTVSDREVVRAVNDAANRADEQLAPAQAQWVQKASSFFAQRLYWRTGYLQLLETHPEFERGGDVQELMGLREPHFDQERFDRWATGNTGFPMVDASMRMLRQTGWINMRMRGMLASFALNELWLPPKPVGEHLARLFLDYEPAIHWSQINIHAGLLSGSRPLVYSPIKQAQDQDPKGVFVRRWVPELAKVPDEHIAQPWLMSPSEQEEASCRIGSLGSDYPEPMVDFKAASKCAKDRVYALREGKPDPGGLPFEFKMESPVLAPVVTKAKPVPAQSAQLSLF
jgi:deoxyribodipyrimidine photo-lyase